MPKVG